VGGGGPAAAYIDAPPGQGSAEVPPWLHRRDDERSDEDRSKTYTAVWLALVLYPIDQQMLPI
jgi:hypothetical protein